MTSKRMLTPEHKQKIKATKQARKTARANALFASGPYALRQLDPDNIVIETAGSDPLYYPCTIDGLTAALSWIAAQRLCRDVERAKSILSLLQDTSRELRKVAEALAKEAGR